MHLGERLGEVNLWRGDRLARRSIDEVKLWRGGLLARWKWYPLGFRGCNYALQLLLQTRHRWVHDVIDGGWWGAWTIVMIAIHAPCAHWFTRVLWIKGTYFWEISLGPPFFQFWKIALKSPMKSIKGGLEPFENTFVLLKSLQSYISSKLITTSLEPFHRFSKFQTR